MIVKYILIYSESTCRFYALDQAHFEK